ncbi:MAG: BamA/TamA family outer membrane protein [Bacteroidales bacterium]|nr:BamA/TamA family outer membrane protein [Bacteroidales bacterium]
MKRIGLFAMLLCLVVSCSTTRSLAPDQSRLAKNEVTFISDEKLSASDITPYIKQQANGRFIGDWSPLMSIYCWGGKVFEKIGTEPVVFDKDLVNESVSNIRTHLEYLGYYNSDVEAEVSTKKKITHVTYRIDLGERKSITGIEYEIPQGEFSDEFYADLGNSLVKEGSFLSEKLLEQESSRSADYFRNLGYYDFSKSNYSFVADTVSKQGETLLKYRIGNYSRNESEQNARPIRKFKIGEVNVSHASTVKINPNIIKNLNTIYPGDWYSEKNVNNTYSRLASLRLFSTVTIEMNASDTATVDCHITLKEAEMKGFKTNLELSTNSTGLIGVTPKVTFYHKNIFHGGEWLNVNVSGNFLFKLNDRNVHSNEFGASTSLSLPRFVGLPYSVFKGGNLPRTEIKLSFNYQNRPEFTRHIASGSFGYTGSFNRTTRYQINPLQLNFIKMAAVSDDFMKTLEKYPYMAAQYTSHMDAGIDGTIIRSTTTDVIPKGSYHIEQFSFGVSGNVISLFNNLLPVDDKGRRTIFGSPYAQYVRGEINLSRGISWGKNDGNTLAFRFLAGLGYAYGNSTAMPYEKAFYSGGANSLRGWQAKAIGPGFASDMNIFAIPNQTGDMKLEANLEYRFKMFSKLEGALFADVGNIWLTGGDVPECIFHFNDFYKSLAADWGLGLRVNLDFILLRLDGGFQAYNPSRKEGNRWISIDECFKSKAFAIHFGVGYPF